MSVGSLLRALLFGTLASCLSNSTKSLTWDRSKEMGSHKRFIGN